MCRRNQLFGVAILAFGLGFLLGGYVGSAFWCACVGVGVMAAGVLWLQKR